jgi:hypothetical protein
MPSSRRRKRRFWRSSRDSHWAKGQTGALAFPSRRRQALYSDPWASTEMGCHWFHVASRDS